MFEANAAGWVLESRARSVNWRRGIFLALAGVLFYLCSLSPSHAAIPGTPSSNRCSQVAGCLFEVDDPGGFYIYGFGPDMASACQDFVKKRFNDLYAPNVWTSQVVAGGPAAGEYAGDGMYASGYKCQAINSQNQVSLDPQIRGQGYQCPANASNIGGGTGSMCSCNVGYDEDPPTHSMCAKVNETNKTQAGVCWKCLLGNPIDPMTGSKSEAVPTGISLRGVELKISYDSAVGLRPASAGNATTLVEPNSVGALWRSNFHHKLQVSIDRTRALLSRGDGQVLTFIGNGAGTFTPDGYNASKLESISGGYRVTDVATGALENFDSTGQLTSIARTDGSVFTFSYNGGNLSSVQSDDGRTVRFVYANNLISKIVGPQYETIAVAYDANQNLSSLTWPDGKVRTFVYENATYPWALTGIVDEKNDRHATFAYDSEGHAASTEHGVGASKYTVSYASSPKWTVSDTYDSVTNTINRVHSWQVPSGTSVTTPNGQTLAFEAQNLLGMSAIASRTQPAGSGSVSGLEATSYDTNGNLASRDDASGKRSCFAYDASHRQTVRVEGLETTVACSAVLSPGATLPAGARKISTSWHPDWKLPVVVTEPLRMATYVYHGQPDPFNGNAAANCTSAAAMPNGKPLPVLCKQVEQATLSTGAASSPVAEDLNLNQVQLLLQGNGGFADSSVNGSTPSTIGAPAISSTQKKYGSGSMSFGGTADALSVPHSAALNLASGDFAIEAWVYLNSLSTNRTVLQKDQNYGTSFPSYAMIIGSNGGLACHVGSGNSGAYSQWFSSPGGLITTGGWHHVACTREGTTLRVFVNGALVQTATQTGTPVDAGAPLLIGRYPAGGGSADGWMSGYIDDLRVTKGAARYTASFTPAPQEAPPPNSAVVAMRTSRFTYDTAGRVLSSVDPNGKTTTYVYSASTSFASATDDPYLNRVVLLLHGNGGNGSTQVMDSSFGQKSISVFGDSNISTAQSKFGGSSLAFDGTGDYILVPHSDDFVFGSGDFTIETYVYKTSNNPNTARIWNPNGDLYDGVSMAVDGNGNFAVYLTTNGTSWTHSLPVVANLANGQWHHLAVVRSGGSVFAFVNGTKYVVTSSLGTTPLWANTSGVGRVIGGQAGTNRALAGFIDDFRITKGVARYTSNFTPATQEFPNTGPGMSATGNTVGDLQSVTNAAGHVTQSISHDPAGHVRQMVDPKGIVTDIAYTPRGWVSTVTVTPPGGSARTTTYTYDNVGQVTGVTLPDATSLTYTYDVAHRLTGASDARGNSVTYTLDDAGNRTAEAVRDPGGTLRRSIARSFDALDRLQQVSGAAQ